MAQNTRVTCQECSTVCGEGTTKDPYSHMLNCLKVDSDSLDRIKEHAEGLRSEYGRRILHMVAALQSPEPNSFGDSE